MRVLHAGPLATVICGDSLDVLPAMDDESVALVVTDPPYGVEQRSNHRAERFDPILGDTQEDRDMVHEVLKHCVRIVGQSRHLFVFGPTDVLDGLKVGKPAALVWDKGTMSGGDTTLPYGTAHEPLSFTVSKYRHGGQAGADTVPARLRRGSVLRYPRPTGRKVRHPSEKPVPLLRELVESSSRQGETVIDPFAGVGGVGVACVLLGRHVVLVEQHPPYADLAASRCAAAERAVAGLDAL